MPPDDREGGAMSRLLVCCAPLSHLSPEGSQVETYRSVCIEHAGGGMLFSVPAMVQKPLLSSTLALLSKMC